MSPAARVIPLQPGRHYLKYSNPYFAAVEHEVVHDSDEMGRVVYRFFARPIPDLVRALREELYAKSGTLLKFFTIEEVDRFVGRW